jgi:hypothetical protein
MQIQAKNLISHGLGAIFGQLLSAPASAQKMLQLSS